MQRRLPHGLPVVAPSPREQARPHSLRRRQEAEQVVNDLVGQGADPVLAASVHGRGLFLLAFRRTGCGLSYIKVVG